MRKPAGREVGEAAGRLEQRQDARVAEAEGRDPLRPLAARGLELRERVLAEWAVPAEALGREHLLVDPRARRPRLRQGLERLAGLEVGRVVDGGLGPERPPLLEGLLDGGGLGRDVQAGGDPGGEHPGPIAVRRSRRAAGQPGGEQQADPSGAAEVEGLADDRLEAVPPPDRPVEDPGPADLELPDAQPVSVAGRPVGRRQRPGQPCLPAVEDALHVGRPEPVAERLELSGASQAGKPLSRAVKPGPARRACCLAHSWPFRQTRTGYGR